MPSDLMIRPASRDDLPAVADIHLRARRAAVPAMPPPVQGRDFVRGYVESWDLDVVELYVAELPAEELPAGELPAGEAGSLTGYAMIQDSWLHSLYVDPPLQGSGIGSSLLDLVKARRPDGFSLYVFESNVSARRFYGRHGLVELETTDGSDNMEQAPDIRMVWPGRDPIGFMRGLVDAVDADLGDLLARRAALTRAIQHLKGGASRDAEREDEIVRRMARVAPELGEERLRRIMHAVITESLDAADPSP
jgi:ribosomal protein S18 acetylase RimI-like enzyme/chorismate mutase